jgi:uncharacterized protein (PEP-CTERM system associated)
VTSYSNFTSARVDSAPAKVAWGLEYNRQNVNYSGQSGFINNVYRGRLTFTPDPQFRVFAIGGYEDNNYSTTQQSGSIYGGGAEWRPTERTRVAGSYERRFFGDSWDATVSHRRPLSFWSLTSVRALSSYPQAALVLPPGETGTVLDSVLLTRFPDPVARQAEVDRLIQTLGLPASLVTPLSFYTQSVFVNEQTTATVGLLGARNTVTFTAFTGESESIPATSDTDVQDIFATATRLKQRGVSGNWNHRLTPLTSMNFLASHIESESAEPSNAKSTTDRFNVNLTRRLSPKTSGSLGLRYIIFDSNVNNDYREAAVFAVVSHTF